LNLKTEKMLRLIIAGVFFALATTSVFAQNYEKVKITTEKLGDGLYDFYAENPNYYPMQLKLEFTELENMAATSDLPLITTVFPGKQKILHVRRVNLEVPGNFKYKTDTRMGAYPVTPDDMVYSLPVGKGRTTKVTQLDFSKIGLPNKVVYQFSINAGDTVFSARAGVVCQVMKSEVVDGMRRGENSITVLHSDNTFGRYELLDGNGFLVALGDSVRAQQPISLSEKIEGSQVQFSVFYANARIDSIINSRIRDYYTYLAPVFLLSKKRTGRLESGSTYTSGEK
jgi:hypothetical protein